MIAVALIAPGCARPSTVAVHDADRWTATWEAAPQLTEPRNLPPAPGLAGSTLRQFLYVTVGGTRVRLRYTNLFGNGPLTIASAHVAVALEGSGIDVRTDRALRFHDSSAITIPAGASVVSDPIDFTLPASTRLAVSLYFGDTPRDVTGHPGSRATSFLQSGNAVSASSLPQAARVEHWYVLTGVDVVTDAGTAVVAILGNSITDGRGSGTDRNNRWPDQLFARLHSGTRTAHVAVLNAGIGGNCVLRGGLGPPALERIERDLFAPDGVRWVIVFEGVNDIGGARGVEGSAQVARELIAAYTRIVHDAHARRLRVYGATILPFAGSQYDTPEHEASRQTVNAWIRSGGAFDAVVDLDAALRDPSAPSRLLPLADSGDHLHPNELGHRMLGAAVDIGLFTR